MSRGRTRPPESRPAKLLLPGLLLAAGILLAGGGAWMLLTDSAARDAGRAAALPRVTPEELLQLPDGAAILLEGRLVAREPLGPQGFVAYRRERYLRTETSGTNEGRDEWMSLGTVTPAIAVEQGASVVEVDNRDYGLRSAPHRWQSDPFPSNTSPDKATERLSGFKAGDSVTVDGRIVAGQDGPHRVLATVLFGGDTSAYLASLREGIVTLKIVGAIFLGFGALLTLAGGWWWKSVRPA